MGPCALSKHSICVLTCVNLLPNIRFNYSDREVCARVKMESAYITHPDGPWAKEVTRPGSLLSVV